MSSYDNQDDNERAAETSRSAASTSPRLSNPGQFVESNSSPDGSVVSPLFFPFYGDLDSDNVLHENSGHVSIATRGCDMGDTFPSDDVFATSLSAAHIPTPAYFSLPDFQNLDYGFSKTQPNTDNFLVQIDYDNRTNINTTSINPTCQCKNHSALFPFEQNFAANNISIPQGNHSINSAEEPTTPPSTPQSPRNLADASIIKEIVELATDKCSNRVIEYFKEIGFNKDLVNNIKKLAEKEEGEHPIRKRARLSQAKVVEEPRRTRRHTFRPSKYMIMYIVICLINLIFLLQVAPMPSTQSAFAVVTPKATQGNPEETTEH